jgi:hypothetical protein
MRQIIICLFLLFLLSACKKDESPTNSQPTRKDLMTSKVWKLDNVTPPYVPPYRDYYDFPLGTKVQFNSDGTMTATRPDNSSESASWQFTEAESKIIVTQGLDIMYADINELTQSKFVVSAVIRGTEYTISGIPN